MNKNKLFLLCAAFSSVINFAAFCSGESDGSGKFTSSEFSEAVDRLAPAGEPDNVNSQGLVVNRIDYSIEKDFIHGSAKLSRDGAPTVECSFDSTFTKCDDAEDGDWLGIKSETYNGSSVQFPVSVALPKNLGPVMEDVKKFGEEAGLPVSLSMLDKYVKLYRENAPKLNEGIADDVNEVLERYSRDNRTVDDGWDGGEYSFNHGGVVLVLAKVFREMNTTQSLPASVSAVPIIGSIANLVVGQHKCPVVKISNTVVDLAGKSYKTMNNKGWAKNLGVFEIPYEVYESLATQSPVALYNYKCDKLNIIDESNLEYLKPDFD